MAEISKVNQSLLDELLEIENNYENLNAPTNEVVFRHEEILYNFIIKNKKKFFDKKINLAEKLRKKDEKLWAIALKHTFMQQSKIGKYNKEQQKFLKVFFDENLSEYYCLKNFADNNFDRDKILAQDEPYKFCFTIFRCDYPLNTSPFIRIVKDLKARLRNNTIDSYDINKIYKEPIYKLRYDIKTQKVYHQGIDLKFTSTEFYGLINAEKRNNIESCTKTRINKKIKNELKTTNDLIVGIKKDKKMFYDINIKYFDLDEN